MIRRLILSIVLATLATAFALYMVALRPAQRLWGVVPEEGAEEGPRAQEAPLAAAA